MKANHYILQYVDNPAASAAFYEKLLEASPVELSETFALFILDGGLKLGLWSKHTVEPAPAQAHIGGTSEIAFALADDAAVRACYTRWKEAGARIVQEPIALDFGFTFVALDPDGHRLRALALGENPV
jgi:predicted enzyme related to lactoylglutathione lyase